MTGEEEVRAQAVGRDPKNARGEVSVSEPLMAWTPTIAPAGLDYYDNSAIPEWQNCLLLVTLKTQSMRVLKLNPEGDAILGERVYFEEDFGRIRDLCVSPSGDVYLSTSNRDWNPADGFPEESDDRIIRITKNKDVASAMGAKVNAMVRTPSTEKKSRTMGERLFKDYCASCHKADGTGVPGTFPPLNGDRVRGDVTEVIRVVLQGLSGPVTIEGAGYNMEMPAFSFLSDEEVARVVEYVRSSFGHSNETVSPKDAERVRNAKR